MKLFHNTWEKWAFIFCLLFLTVVGINYANANCTGCGDDGHQQCPIEGADHKHDPEVVFAAVSYTHLTLPTIYSV